MCKKVDLDNMMYKVLLLLAFASSISTALTSIGIVFGTILVLIQGISTRRVPRPDRKITVVVLIFSLLQVLIAIMSLNPGESMLTVWGMTYRFLPLFFALLYIKSIQQVKWIFIMIMFSMTIDNAVGLYQFFFSSDHLPCGLNNTHTFYGDYLIMVLPILCLIAKKNDMPRWSRVWSVFMLMFTFLMLILSMTRGAWVALLVMFLFWMIFDRRLRWKAVAAGGSIAVLCLFLSVVSPGFQQRASSIINPQHEANTERVLMWESAVNMTMDYPIFGVGQEQFGLLYNTQYISPLAKERSMDGDPRHGHGHPHNNILKTAAEGGCVGVLAYFMLYGYFFYRLYCQYCKEERIMEVSYAMMGLLILIGIQASGTTDTNITQVPIMREFWLLMGTLLAAGKLEVKK